MKTSRLFQALGGGSRALAHFLVLIWIFATAGIVFALGASWLINTLRPTEYWMEYLSIDPAHPYNALDEPLMMRTTAIRHRSIDAHWADALYCVNTEGEDAGEEYLVDAAPTRERRRIGPALLGFKTSPDPDRFEDYELRSGLWVWAGVSPVTPSVCYVAAELRFCPSPWVCKSARHKSSTVIFYDPARTDIVRPEIEMDSTEENAP